MNLPLRTSEIEALPANPTDRATESEPQATRANAPAAIASPIAVGLNIMLIDSSGPPEKYGGSMHSIDR